jgi:hypothetical protein
MKHEWEVISKYDRLSMCNYCKCYKQELTGGMRFHFRYLESGHLNPRSRWTYDEPPCIPPIHELAMKIKERLDG